MNPSDELRLQALKQWLASLAHEHQLNLETLRSASSDASFRRYFRLEGREGTLIAMDAPPQREDCRPFVLVGEKLRQAGVNVPHIYAQDLDQGFLLISDLGRQNYYHAITQGMPDDRLQALYRQAIAALVRLQHADTAGLPNYDKTRLRAELDLFPQWYVERHCQSRLDDAEQAMLEKIFLALAQDAAAQAVVLVHRDYHSPNLMMPAPGSSDAPGVIDYQDALAGPITYDIASLVMDARTTWEEAQQLDWAIRYWQAARDAGLPVHSDFADFHRAYEWTSLQRNLRILGVFARLSHRDGKDHYIDHIPRVQAYVRQVAGRYGIFAPLLRLLDRLEGRQVSYGYTF
ncbi:aminoglycoside phosphotransferase family protein [Pusillimonas sp.]|uniref:aminoglycoside phosphotransferase family protein n=1 Tax=Pusillimonas sp. TaxID=3040095 RepID=UPI0037CC2C91